MMEKVVISGWHVFARYLKVEEFTDLSVSGISQKRPKERLRLAPIMEKIGSWGQCFPMAEPGFANLRLKTIP